MALDCCRGFLINKQACCPSQASLLTACRLRDASVHAASIELRNGHRESGTRIRTQTLISRRSDVRRGRIDCSGSAAGFGPEDGGAGGAGVSSSDAGGDANESPFQTLGVSPLEKFEVMKSAYSRRRKDAERRGDEAVVERLDRAYDRIMMMQLSNRKQGLAFGGQFEVSKEIKYADKRSWIPWGPKKAVSEKREVLINLAIAAFFSVWMVASGQAEWKPLQFLIFGYMFRIFNKLKEYEPAESSFVPEEEEEGGDSRATSRRFKNGKRLLRTLGLVFSCVALASLAFTGTLNAYELLGQLIPRKLLGAQELFVTVVSAATLFIMGSFYR